MKLKYESEKMRAVFGLIAFVERSEIPSACAHDTLRRGIDPADDIEQRAFAAAAIAQNA